MEAKHRLALLLLFRRNFYAFYAFKKAILSYDNPEVARKDPCIDAKEMDEFLGAMVFLLELSHNKFVYDLEEDMIDWFNSYNESVKEICTINERYNFNIIKNEIRLLQKSVNDWLDYINYIKSGTSKKDETNAVCPSLPERES